MLHLLPGHLAGLHHLDHVGHLLLEVGILRIGHPVSGVSLVAFHPFHFRGAIPRPQPAFKHLVPRLGIGFADLAGLDHGVEFVAVRLDLDLDPGLEFLELPVAGIGLLAALHLLLFGVAVARPHPSLTLLEPFSRLFFGDLASLDLAFKILAHGIDALLDVVLQLLEFLRHLGLALADLHSLRHVHHSTDGLLGSHLAAVHGLAEFDHELSDATRASILVGSRLLPVTFLEHGLHALVEPLPCLLGSHSSRLHTHAEPFPERHDAIGILLTEFTAGHTISEFGGHLLLGIQAVLVLHDHRGFRRSGFGTHVHDETNGNHRSHGQSKRRAPTKRNTVLRK